MAGLAGSVTRAPGMAEYRRKSGRGRHGKRRLPVDTKMWWRRGWRCRVWWWWCQQQERRRRWHQHLLLAPPALSARDQVAAITHKCSRAHTAAHAATTTDGVAVPCVHGVSPRATFVHHIAVGGGPTLFHNLPKE